MAVQPESSGEATTRPVAYVVGSGNLAGEVTKRLHDEGWDVVFDVPDNMKINAFVFDPGLAELSPESLSSDVFLKAVDQLENHFDENHARIVAVVGREVLGWPTAADHAARSGAIASAARSLALKLAPQRITVNVVAATVTSAYSALIDQVHTGQSQGLNWPEPTSLLPGEITPEGIADAVGFFVDAQSEYITGQQFYVCGGSSLLSSLAV